LLLDKNMNIKLADFGFANYYDMINPLKTFCGSAPYAAPEVFCGQKYYGPEIDVWSLGVILFVLVTGTLPFNSDNIQQLKQRILACKYIMPSYISVECADLIQKILVVNSNDRFTLEQIKQHSWFKINNITFSSNLNGNTSSLMSQREKFIESRNENFSISTGSYESISEIGSCCSSKDDGYDKNILNLMKTCGFDINETVFVRKYFFYLLSIC
jgi:serine/threonine protein kinase